MPTPYRISGITYENASLAPNLLIAYKADRADLPSLGEELDRVTAGADGLFQLDWDDYSGPVTVVALDPSDSVKYDAKVEDWIFGENLNFDPLIEDVVLLMHMEGTNGGTSFLEHIEFATVTPLGDVNTSTVQAKVGTSSAAFDGSGDDALTIPYFHEYELGVEDFCIEFWIYPNSVTGVQMLVCNRDLAVDTGHGQFVIDMTGATLRTYVRVGVATWASDVTAGTLTISQWQHVAFVREGSGFRVYIDGQQTGSFSSSLPVYYQTEVPIRIGLESDGTNPFDGYIDEFRITVRNPRYISSFIPREITYPNYFDPDFSSVVLLFHFEAAHNSFIFTDEIGNSANGTGSAKISEDEQYFGLTSLNIGALDGRVTIPYDSSMDLGSGDFTVEFWVWVVDISSSNTIFAHDDTFSTTPQIRLNIYNNGWIRVYYGDTIQTNNTGICPQQQWTHIAMVRDGINARMFVNGIETWTDAGLGATSLVNNMDDFHIGGELVDGHSANGYVDDFRFSKIARYTSDFDVPTKRFPNL